MEGRAYDGVVGDMRWDGEGVREENRLLSEDRRPPDLDDNDGVLGRAEKRFILSDKLFLKLFGGGLGASPVTSGEMGDSGRSCESRRDFSNKLLCEPSSKGAVICGLS